MKVLVVFVLLLLPLTASAKRLECSIHPRDISNASLPGLAKVSQADAQATALATIAAPDASKAQGKLEVDRGCLVYTVEIRVPGKMGVEEVIVDAGTGSVLSKRHVITEDEAAGKAN
jgi:hypothetical protein